MVNNIPTLASRLNGLSIANVAASSHSYDLNRRRCAVRRSPVVSETCGVGVPTVESFTGPTAARFRSASNGAHSRSRAERGCRVEFKRIDVRVV